MALAGMDRTAIVAKARQLLGVTDGTKGGPDDTVFEGQISHALSRFALLAGALQSVVELPPEANNKYVPLPDEVLWPITVSFLDSNGVTSPMSVLNNEPTPGTPVGGVPASWWLTAVNDDTTGKSTRNLGIDPPSAVNGDLVLHVNVLVLEVIQLPQDFSGPTDTPEIQVSLHPYIAYFLADEMLGMFPEKIGAIRPLLLARQAEGVEQFQKLVSPTFKTPTGRRQVMGYSSLTRNRL